MHAAAARTAQHALQREVVRLRRARREDQLLGRRADTCADARARSLDELPRSTPYRMLRGWIAELVL